MMTQSTERVSESNPRQALLVLVGITAGWRKRRQVQHYFETHWQGDVYVPALPYRQSLNRVAAWYADYLQNTVRPARYGKVHCIAYIAAGFLLRSFPPGDEPRFERMVCFRGPYQERVAARLVQRIGRLPAALIAGKSMLDLADGWPARLPQCRQARHEALIVEQGRSRMARLLGIQDDALGPGAWSATALSSTAEAVLRVPHSHDDVYTADAVLDAALGYIRDGAFPANQIMHEHANSD